MTPTTADPNLAHGGIDLLDVEPDVEPDQLDDEADPAPPYDPLAALTINELDAGSRLLKASLMASVMERTALYEKALAVVVWLHARRADRSAQLTPILALTFYELNARLGALGPDEASPTPPAPA